MRLPWKKSKEPKAGAPFGGELEASDFALLRHHALRVLCGALMDRHTDCRSPHPFCGQVGHPLTLPQAWPVCDNPWNADEYLSVTY